MQHEAGQVARTPQEAKQLAAEDYLKCRNPTCNYFISPVELESMEQDGYYFSCPKCKRTYPLLDPAPFTIRNGAAVGNPQAQGQEAQGIKNRNYETQVGLTMKEQGDIAEDLVQGLKTIPGYGPITWWSQTYNDPIDGGCGQWGVEVKAICIDAKNHRFIPGHKARKEQMIARAQELGFKGVLGVLVILDYRRSVADIYTMEMPNEQWTTQAGRQTQGPVAFRSHNGQHLVAEVPFKNPFLNPQNTEPQVYEHTGDDIPF